MYVYGVGKGNIFLDEEVKNDHQICQFYITFIIINQNVWFDFFFMLIINISKIQQYKLTRAI